MSLLCAVGKHDWEIVEYIDYWYFMDHFGDILDVTTKEPANCSYVRGVKKVCLNCGCCVDETLSLETEYLKIIKEREDRKNLAKYLWSKR